MKTKKSGYIIFICFLIISVLVFFYFNPIQQRKADTSANPQTTIKFEELY